MTAALAYAALFLAVLAVGRWCQLRVAREYAAGGLLSIGSVWLAWLIYALQIAFVAIPALGGWARPPGAALAWRVPGALLVVLGLAFAAWGVASFRSFRRMNGRDTSELVTGGAYRYSRNPQNVGLGWALVGIACLGPSGVALAAAALFWLLFRAYVPIEERFLESTHGDRYRAYRERSHRYLGPPVRHDAAA